MRIKAERSRNRENAERPFHHRDCQPALDRCRVRLRAPPDIGAVQTFLGQHLAVGRDGTVEMWAEDAQYLVPAGWTKLAEWTTDEDGTAQRSEPNLFKPCPSPARWSGSKRRRKRAEQSGGPV